jgi:hypothetical protein
MADLGLQKFVGGDSSSFRDLKRRKPARRPESCHYFAQALTASGLHPEHRRRAL